MAGDFREKAKKEHYKLCNDIHMAIGETTDDFLRFKTSTKAYLAHGIIAGSKNVLELLEALERIDKLAVGEYTVLKDLLAGAQLFAVQKMVKKAEEAILKLMNPTETGMPQQRGSSISDDLRRMKLESDDWRTFYRKKTQDNFVMTGAYHEARDVINTKRSVMLVGGSGDGKSAIIHHLAANEMLDYLPVELSSPTEIKEYVDCVRAKQIKLLFILDDVVGGSYLDGQKVGDWIRLCNILEMYLESHKFLLATRTNVWEQCRVQLQDSELFSNTVQVTSAKLTTEDKMKLLEKSLGSSGNLTETQKQQIVASSKLIAYNQCCHLMGQAIEKGKSGADLITIFEKPYTFLKKELEKMADKDKVTHATLCLMMLCGGELKCRELTGTLSEVTPSVRERIDAVLEACGCPGQTTGNLQESAEKLCGTFLEKLHKPGEDSTRCEVCMYTFSHDSVREAVTMQYGGRHFRHCLQFLTPDLIVKISRPHSYEKDEHEFVVCVLEINNELARVFTKAAIAGKWSLCDVFKNPFVREENFQQVWVEYLKSDPDKQTAFIESKSWDGRCVWHLSTQSGAFTLWRFLHNDLHVKCSCQYDFTSHLCQAARLGDKQTVINLMTSHKQTDYQIHQAFLVACMNGRLGVIEPLLHGINDDRARDDTIATGLKYACRNGQGEIVDHLLGKHYSPCIGDKCPCIDGLVFASSEGQTDIVHLLLSHGTDINYIANLGGTTGLHWAAYYGHLHTVQALLRYGADVHLTDRYNMTALDWAKQEGHTAIVDLLVKHGKDGN